MLDNFLTIEGLSVYVLSRGLTNLTLKTIYLSFVPPYKKERILEQANKAGVDSLPLVSLIALFIGLSCAATAHFMQR